MKRMARNKVYPRHVGKDGNSRLLLVDVDVLGEIDTSWVVDDFAVQTVVRLFNEWAHAAATWFYVETGIKLYVEATPEGILWCVPDQREYSQKYRWLEGKAIKVFEKILGRLNSDGKDICDRQRMVRYESKEG